MDLSLLLGSTAKKALRAWRRTLPENQHRKTNVKKPKRCWGNRQENLWGATTRLHEGTFAQVCYCICCVWRPQIYPCWWTKSYNGSKHWYFCQALVGRNIRTQQKTAATWKYLSSWFLLRRSKCPSKGQVQFFVEQVLNCRKASEFVSELFAWCERSQHANKSRYQYLHAGSS